MCVFLAVTGSTSEKQLAYAMAYGGRFCYKLRTDASMCKGMQPGLVRAHSMAMHAHQLHLGCA